MLQVSAHPVSLPFQYPFTIAKGTKTEQPALLVSLSFGKLQGWGEAPAIRYYNVTVAGMIEALQNVKPTIERYALTDPRRFWHFLHHLLPGQNFLIAALDIAGWDLFARLRKQPLHMALGWPIVAPKPCDYTIGLGTATEMQQKLRAHPSAIYKLKLASPDDIDRVRALRSLTASPFRVDVNEGWQYDDTVRLLPELHRLGVILLEQPLPKDAWEESAALKAQSPIPIFADEACIEERDIARCAGAFHGINIKLTKCGGITPALRMMETAKAAGLQVMLGSMNESSIGAAAIAHLSPAADFLDADGPLLLAGDYADGLRWSEQNGLPYYLAPGEGTGLGITMREGWQRYVTDGAA